MPLYSGFFGNTVAAEMVYQQQWKEFADGNSFLSANDVAAESLPQDIPPKLGILVRHESFKRSRSLQEYQAGDCVPPPERTVESFEPGNQQPFFVGENDYLPEDKVMQKKEVAATRGQKRTAIRRTSDMRTKGELQQDEIASRIVTYLTERYQGHIVQKPAFHGSKNTPTISILKYVQRVIKFTNQYAEEEDGPLSLGVRCAAVAVQYIERADLKLEDTSIHRCFLIAYLIGLKLIYDFYMSNSFWAQVGGLCTHDVNSMEIVFCESLHWNFSIRPEDHEKRLNELVS